MSETPTPVPLGPRAFARFADIVLVLIPVWMFLVPLIATAGDGSIAVIASAVALGYLVTIWYEGAMTAATGQTVGKKAAGLRVVQVDDPTQPPSRRSAVIRASVPLATGALFAPLGPLSALAGWLAPYLMGLTAPDRRGLHDRLSGTTVVAVVT